jgi:hypothetical protein
MATVAGVKIKPKAKKEATKRITSQSIREHAKRDHSPVWVDCETWTDEQFHRNYKRAMQYYNFEFSNKDLKPAVLKWMAENGYSKETIAEFKGLKDWRCNSTMGGVASCLLRGMTPDRPGFNKGRNTAEWLKKEIGDALEEGVGDAKLADEADEKPSVAQVTIQDRVREASFAMTDELETAIEEFNSNPDEFDPKAFKVLNLLKGKQAKAAHARIIKGFYSRNLEELTEAATTKDEQLKEAYKHLSKNNLKKITQFYQEIVSACDMLAQEAKVNRAPRAKKAVPKDKVVSKLKYLKTFEPLKLVSVNPTDIIGAKELWVYNTKSRKLGRYVATEYQELNVKGTSIINFSETLSVCKTLRKPEEKLKEFKAAGKVQLRKFLDDINATETKMNGRLNEETILLKVA